MDVIPLASGFPGASDRGFLGWSSCVLLRGEKPMLFDALGYNERYVLLDRLRRERVEPEAVAVLFLSHFHFDHAVNYRLFPNAVLYLHEEELDYARRSYRDDLAIPIEMLADLESTGRLRLLSGERGDAEGVEWFLAPGHTAGLYALRVQQDDKRLVLASDAVKNLGELLSGQVAMAWDREASARSVASVIERADLVLPGHDRMIEVRRSSASTQPRFVPIGQNEFRIRLADEQPGEQREWLIDP